MTVTASSSRRTYAGNGVATVFDGPMAYQAEHIAIFLVQGSVTTVVPKNAYMVDRLGNKKGARITMDAAPTISQSLLIVRVVPYSQDTDITNQGRFLPETLEKGLDVLCMQIQQLYDSGMHQIIEDGGGFVWDAKDARIINVGDAIAEKDAMNLRSVLMLIEQIQQGGGTIGVAPKFWDFVGDGESTDFPLDGADVFDPLFYDTALELSSESGVYTVSKPIEEYKILEGAESAPPAIRFTVAPADGVRGFTTLRGYARPWIGQVPIYTVAPTIVSVTTNSVFAGDMHNTLILASSAVPITITIKLNTGSNTDWKSGQFFSVMQLGAGQVTIIIEGGGGQLNVPVGFEAKTRSQRSVISATCIASDMNAWVVAGDILRSASNPDLQCIALHDRSVLITAEISAGSTKDSFVLPYGILLDSVVNGGIYATLSTAQAAGALLTVDVNRNGASILSTKLTFDNNEKSTTTAATPAVFETNGSILAKGDEITIDVDQVGTSLAKGLRVYLVGQRAS